MILLYIDTETTGLDTATCSIWQLSGYISDTSTGASDSFDYKMRPYRNEIISKEAAAKTGATQEELDSYTSQSEAFSNFTALLGKYVDLEDWNQNSSWVQHFIRLRLLESLVYFQQFCYFVL